MNHHVSFLKISFALTALLAGCGATDDGTGNGNNGNNPDGGAGVCVKVTETEVNCANGLDDNCDGKIDCENTECSFDPACTGGGGGGGGGEDCGELSFGGDPLAIPDGIGIPYEASMNIQGFDNGQTLDVATGFDSVCVVMEHSWLRDLQIELSCPSGQTMILQQFLGQEGGELYMGVPNDGDSTDPVPGTGAEYCWKTNAANPPMLEWANMNPGDIFTPTTLPAGDYKPNGSVQADLLGCTLNGDWTIRAVDDWGIDNGYIFEWAISFSEDIIPDCLIVVE